MTRQSEPVKAHPQLSSSSFSEPTHNKQAGNTALTRVRFAVLQLGIISSDNGGEMAEPLLVSGGLHGQHTHGGAGRHALLDAILVETLYKLLGAWHGVNMGPHFGLHALSLGEVILD